MTDTVYLEGFAQGSLSISSTGAHTAVLERGTYDVWSAIECYLKVDETASDVTTTTGYILYPNTVVPLFVDDSRKIGAITAAASGTLYYHRVA